MGAYVRVASTSELTPGQCKVVETAGHQLALFNVDGTYYALENACFHRGGPLGEGALDGCVVTCPWHGWQYDVVAGSCITNPKMVPKSYLVRVEGSDVKVEI
jgi:nitrite reductase (NADH) small subunit